ncbi:MAG: LuxR C-terminal-related transcriptional regulator, partial [Acidimicrobiales bacterium]
ASGFLLKDSTPEELVHAVRVVAAGDSLLSPAVTTRLLARVLPSLNAPPATPWRDDGGLSQLTEREVEVLELVAQGRSNAEIAADLYISEATVKTHVSHVLAKLGLRDRVQAVVAAFEMGLVTPGT